MNIEEHIPLSEKTTFRIGGLARFFITAHSAEGIKGAVQFAQKKGLPLLVLSGGSNVLVNDEGFDGVVLHIAIRGITHTREGDTVQVRVEAGEAWDTLVQYCSERGWWGLENLSGIPGYVGASLVQNIGAYGVEVSSACQWAEVFDTETEEMRIMKKEECAFGYRKSIFQEKENLIITRVCFVLTTNQKPNLEYKDLARYIFSTTPHPKEVREAVLLIRSRKFPSLIEYGTAGSFFKNPSVTKEQAERLLVAYPSMPNYPDGERVKISLAWILDNVLHLNGYTQGRAGLYCSQPLVLVTEKNATARDVFALAREVQKQVQEKIHLTIEPEVTFISQNKKIKNFL